MHWNAWWNTIVHFVSTWGSNGLVDAIAGALLTLIAVFFRKIIHFFSQVAKWFSAIIRKDRKYYNFEKAYLTWMINRHRYLGLLPARIVTARWGEGRRIVDLEKVYVTLQVSVQGGDQDKTETYNRGILSWRKQPWFYSLLKYYQWTIILLLALCIIIINYFLYLWPVTVLLALLLASILFIRRRVLRKEETYRTGALGQVINRYKQLIIRGDPGSGKTTLLRYLAVTCARALRDDKKQGDSPDLVKKRLLWSTTPFPILVTLRRHNDVKSWDQKKHLIDAFFEEMPVELRNQYPEGFFERQLNKGNCLILLDAFDELGSPEARDAMARRIGGFLNIYNHLGNRVVMTTRIVGYEGQLDQYGFQIRTVQNLNAGETRALVKQRYRAIAFSETAGWLSHDAAPVLQDMRQRSERLLKKIESTPRLAQLATNPLLLSLIVLVHYVKLELPQERVLLYRDCVEILTEQWQRSKKAAIDTLSDSQEDLTLPQKLGLLQELALTMQQQREEENRQTLLPRVQVQEIIARKLPDILGSQLPATEQERQEMCRRKAEAWISSIQVESGILVEQGLDEAGDPLIGFSHLTFQEYLAAVAINEDLQYLHLLRSNLLQPAWSQVALLYVALTSDATAIIAHLLDVPAQPVGVLLAGSCLAERVRHVKNEAQQLTLEKLKTGFEQANSQTVASFGQVLAAVGGDEVTTFMRGQLHSAAVEKRLEAVKALGHIKPNDLQIKNVQEDLVNLMETPNDVALMIAARESLAQIGDPRFTGREPMSVSIPPQSYSIPSSPKWRKDLIASPEWVKAKKLSQKLSQIARLFDYWLFTTLHPLRQKLPRKYAFEIGKYLITNVEYARFVEATEYRIPKYWIEGTYPTEKATHPVTGITPKDAKAYCKWLSQETGKTYRLPTEWEWEWTATGSQGWNYPWGDQFDQDKCNTKEAAIEETTPVGSYLAGINQYGIADMSGNVWEITQGYMSLLKRLGVGLGIGLVAVAVALLVERLIEASILGAGTGAEAVKTGIVEEVLAEVFVVLILLLALMLVLILILAVVIVLGIALGIALGELGGILGALGLKLLVLSVSVLEMSLRLPPVLRGGAFNTPSNKATCFFREEYSSSIKEIGFRCVKDS